MATLEAKRALPETSVRGDVRAHGDREMPVWGEIFIIEEQRSPQRARESKAKLIAEYIGKLQQ